VMCVKCKIEVCKHRLWRVLFSVTAYSLVNSYQCFGRTCSLHHKGRHWRWRHRVPLRDGCILSYIHGMISHEALILMSQLSFFFNTYYRNQLLDWRTWAKTWVLAWPHWKVVVSSSHCTVPSTAQLGNSYFRFVAFLCSLLTVYDLRHCFK
jgi:hypothetical protein